MTQHTLLRTLIPKKARPFVGVIVIVLLLLAQYQGWFGPSQSQNQPQNQNQSQSQTAEQQEVARGTYQVSRFVDGDTLAVMVGSKKETVRIIGIDTPETHAPGKPVQCYGPAAAAYLKNIIGDKAVTLESDPKNDDRDKYGRLLRHVYLPNGESVALKIVQNGYGFAYTVYPFTGKDTYVAAEAQAEEQAKGLWGNCEVIQQGSRKQTAPQ